MSRIAVVLALAGLTILPATAAAKPADFSAVGTQTSLRQITGGATFTETLRQGPRRIGSDRITCLTVSGSFFDCSGTFAFKDGTIRIAGRINEANRANQVRIVGGSGGYRGARGVVRINDTAPKTTAESFRFR